ncbi:MAG: GbsR/MarR family transcriptional regulator [Dichotomicrobium sp.]
MFISFSLDETFRRCQLTAMEHAQETSEKFIERMGLVAEADGLSRTAGRILGLMVMEGGPLSFAEISERLEVSRASVSTNTRFLERVGVIERVAIKGERQDHFRLARAPYARLLEGSVERMKKARAVVAEAEAELGGEDEGRRQRLEELGTFYDALTESFATLAARFSRRH